MPFGLKSLENFPASEEPTVLWHMRIPKAPPLGQAESRRRDDSGIRKELQFRDTRHTAATRLFEADATLQEIAAHKG